MVATEGPVTVAVSRQIKPEHSNDYIAWCDAIASAASKHPGHLGSGLIRPAEEDGEYTLIYRFDTREHLDAWLSSDERARLIREIDPMVARDAHSEMVTGLEYWFRDPQRPDPIPVWKQATLTWVGLYPTSLFIQFVALPFIGGWPLALRALFTTACTVPVMTWFMMPIVTKVFSGWLDAGDEGHSTSMG